MQPTRDNGHSKAHDLEADFLSELDGQTFDELRKARRHERYQVHTIVVLRAANSSAAQAELHGTTADVSSSGCRAVFPRPVFVGDLFQLRFEGSQLDAPLVFARCLRCRLIREDAFETGFSFFTPIALPGAKGRDEDLLG